MFEIRKITYINQYYHFQMNLINDQKLIVKVVFLHETPGSRYFREFNEYYQFFINKNYLIDVKNTVKIMIKNNPINMIHGTCAVYMYQKDSKMSLCVSIQINSSTKQTRATLSAQPVVLSSYEFYNILTIYQV